MYRYYLISAFLLIYITSASQTILQPGDLALVSLGANVGTITGDCLPDQNGNLPGRDRISFICFKDIETGTVIDITDNGWERQNPGLWGNTEGFIRLTRTGPTIPAGTVITFEFPTQLTDPYEATSPDDNWSFEPLGINALNFNDSGDQLYFMQGGNWDIGTRQGCCNGNQDASYIGGRILFAFNSKTDWISLGMDRQDSGLHPDVANCSNMAPTSGVTEFTSYAGPLTETSQLEWIQRISNPDNWVAFADCSSYFNQTFLTFIPIGPSDMAISCTTCLGCEQLTDDLVLTLPDVGGPFTVEYTNGVDTFLVMGAANGTMVNQSVDSTTTFDLVSVTGTDGCTIFSNFDSNTTLEVSKNLAVNILRQQSAECGGSGNGLIEIEIIDGIGPYTINWNVDSLDGRTLASNLPPGEYIIDVTDAAGCSASNSTILFQSIPLEISCDVSQPASGSNSNDGEISIMVTGGIMPYSLDWVGPNNLSGSTSDNVSNPIGITGLPEGTYDIVITDDNGCSQNCSVIIGPVVCNLEILDLTIQDPSCDSLNGSINVIITGENGTNINYDWADPSIDGQSNPSNLGPGSYRVRVTDSANCEAIDSAVLVQPAPPIINCTVLSNNTMANGSDGQVTLEVTDNGITPFKVKWINPISNLPDSIENIMVRTIDITNLVSGTYDFMLIDATGCSTTCTTEILDFVTCTLDLELFVDQPTTCNEPDGGRLEARFTGENGRVSNFDWNIDRFDGQSQVAGLGAGNYSLTITDDTGCTASDTVDFLSFVPMSINCQIIVEPSLEGNDGIAQLEIIGGTTPFEIQLEGPSTQNLFSDGTSIIGFSDLQKGVYVITVIDAALCSQECTINLGPVNCTLDLDFNASNPDCIAPNSGAIDVTVRGAEGQITYDWEDDRFDGLSSITGLEAGTYLLTVIDEKNCELTDSITLAVDSDIDLSCEVVQEESQPQAFDGIAQLSVTGGELPFQVSWTSTNNLNGSLVDQNTGLIQIEGLSSGIYDVMITDANGCTAPCSFTVSRTVNNTCSINLQMNGVSPSCLDPNSGAIFTIVNGATGNVTYDWSADTFDGMDTLLSVPVGIYELTITDENSCVDSALVEITDTQSLLFEFETVQPSTCAGLGGEIAITTIAGGAAPFFASLDGNTPVEIQTFPFNFSGLAGGQYELLITDNIGCRDSTSVTIDESGSILTVTIGPDFAIEAGTEVILQGLPNFTPTTITWTASDSTSKLPDSLAITVIPTQDVIYTLTVGDSFGCTVSDEIFISVDSKTKVYVPNAFTPNGDGKNDRFSVYGGLNIAQVKSLMIFDRWGELVFEALDFPSDERFGWDGNFYDGQVAREGVYIYVATVEKTDGTEETLKGELNLIR